MTLSSAATLTTGGRRLLKALQTLLNSGKNLPAVLMLLGILAALLPAAATALTLQDDAGTTINLASPAKRIVSLAPHITEVLFAAGAGSSLVGTVTYSDFPEAAKKIPLVGSYNEVNFEQILALQPDLIIGWQTGNNSEALDKLKTLNLPLYLSEPKDLVSIARNIRQFGILAGTEAAATAAADAFEQKLAQLKAANAGKPVVTLFYQVWEEPLYTLGGAHFSRDMFAICGGRNIFADLDNPAPVVSVEAIVTRNPQVMLTGGHHGERTIEDWKGKWAQWTSIDAVKHDQLYLVDQDIYTRSSPRAVQGAEDLCRILDQARKVYFGK